MICSAVVCVRFMVGFLRSPRKPSHFQWLSSWGPNQRPLPEK
jgi:hypothetical protein